MAGEIMDRVVLHVVLALDTRTRRLGIAWKGSRWEGPVPTGMLTREITEQHVEEIRGRLVQLLDELVNEGQRRSVEHGVLPWE